VIRFYFDYLSPYAYLAWTRVRPLAARVGETVEPVPILLAALLDAWGQKGPAEIPPKREWTFKDVVRRAHAYGVPLVPPPAHPFNPLPAARATLAVRDVDRERVIDALYAAAWGGGGGVDGADRVARVLGDAGLDGDAIVRDAASAGVKQQLRDLTESARREGVFGVPTTILRGELFWGDDALPQLEAFARGEDTLDPAWLERWRTLPASAARKA
jgi:2-hydroxychromene-2-carboxylate isomerase